MALAKKFIKSTMVGCYSDFVKEGGKHRPAKFYNAVRDQMIRSQAKASAGYMET